MYEIATALNGDFDYLFCATSSCGTLRGCAEFKKLNNLRARITAVDAAGSVIFGGPKSPRLIPGHGASIVPGLFRDDLADEYALVTDLDCVIGCYRLLNHEAILAGGSSGGVVTAIERSLSKIPRGSVCVAILPDRGERYLDTIYSKEWLSKHFGNIWRHLAAITDNGA
jgi:cysteine synthase A